MLLFQVEKLTLKISFTKMCPLVFLIESLPNLKELIVGKIYVHNSLNEEVVTFFDSGTDFKRHNYKEWHEVEPHKNLRKLEFNSIYPVSTSPHCPTVTSRVLLPIFMAMFPNLSQVTVVKI